MERILVTLPVEDRHRAAFESAAPLAEILYMAADSVTEDILGTVTAVIGNVSAARFKNFANIRWVQLNLAGTDGFTSPGVLAPGTVLTNASGAYGLAVSEHMLGQLLMQIKRLDQYQDAQRKRQWTDFGTVKSIWGSRTLVVGLGDIGGAFARKMYALGSEVQGIRKSPGEKPEELEAVGTFAQLDEWLPEADFVALSLPGTPATYHLFGAERLARMKPGAVLINAGRGQTVDSLALNDALRNGRLGGTAACGSSAVGCAESAVDAACLRVLSSAGDAGAHRADRRVQSESVHGRTTAQKSGGLRLRVPEKCGGQPGGKKRVITGG